MAKRRKRNRTERKRLLATHGGRLNRVNRRGGDWGRVDVALQRIAEERQR